MLVAMVGLADPDGFFLLYSGKGYNARQVTHYTVPASETKTKTEIKTVLSSGLVTTHVPDSEILTLTEHRIV